jgi:hypothetical protein
LSFENYSMGGLAGAYRCVQKRFPGDTALLRKYAGQLVNEHPRDAGGVFAHPREPGGKIWVDCLMAVCPFLSMAAEVLNEPRLHEESIAQYLGMERALLDPKLGLFHQSRNFGSEGITVDTWGRGNGWALLALAELIRWLPENHPRRSAMIGRLERLLSAVGPLQRPSGMWGQNLVTPDSYEETSGTGLILYALAMGLRRGWLPESMGPMARRAWNGLASKVDARGAVHGTCVGTLGKTGSTGPPGPMIRTAAARCFWRRSRCTCGYRESPTPASGKPPPRRRNRVSGDARIGARDDPTPQARHAARTASTIRFWSFSTPAMIERTFAFAPAGSRWMAPSRDQSSPPLVSSISKNHSPEPKSRYICPLHVSVGWRT